MHGALEVPVLSNSSLDSGLGRRSTRNVYLDVVRGGLADASGERVSLRGWDDVEDDNVRALVDKGLGDGASNSSSSTGDDLGKGSVS